MCEADRYLIYNSIPLTFIQSENLVLKVISCCVAVKAGNSDAGTVSVVKNFILEAGVVFREAQRHITADVATRCGVVQV